MNNIANLEDNVLSYFIRCDREELKKLTTVFRQIDFNPSGRAIITLAEEYLKIQDPDNTFFDYVLYEYPNANHFADLQARYVGKKIFLKQLGEFVDYHEERVIERRLKQIGSKPIKEVLKDLKDLKPISATKPQSLNDIRDSRLYDRTIEKNAPSTGYRDLDNLIKGFLPGHVYTMTGDTNVGKTQIACNFAYRVALQSKRVLYFALEPDNTIIEYLASVWAHKPFRELTPDDLVPPVTIDVFTKDQVKNLSAMTQIIEDSERYDLIIIDHFGYFTTTESNNKTQQESNAMKTIAQLAKRQKCAFLSIVHLRKPSNSSKNRVISMNDISGSAAFKQDSTEVLLVFRETREEDRFNLDFKDTGFILVAKTKAGRSGTIEIAFVPNTAIILDSYDQAETY